MRVKRITIRVSPELHRQLSEEASHRSISLNTLATQALESYAAQTAAGQESFPLLELRALLAPAGEAARMTEEDLLGYARQVRRRIWQERYERAIQSDADRPQTA